MSGLKDNVIGDMVSGDEDSNSLPNAVTGDEIVDSEEMDEDDDDHSDHSSEEEENEESTDDEDDEVVRCLRMAATKKKADTPPAIKLSATASTISFHPEKDLIVACDYDGAIQLYSYSEEENKLLNSGTPYGNDASVRELVYSYDYKTLITAFNNRDLMFYDIETWKPSRVIESASSAPISSMYTIDEHTFACGDDDGNIQIWDLRSKQDAETRKVSEDAITGMISNGDKKVLVCSSAEGSLYALKTHGNAKVVTESEIYDYEFNCLNLFKQDSKIAVGSGCGDVFIFNWDEFGKHSDTYTGPGKGNAINSLIPITEHIILTGGDDGVIRAVNFFPQKYLGIVGKSKYPIDKLDVCNDGHLIASIGLDEMVKFWNVSYLETYCIPTKSILKSRRKGSGKSKTKESFMRNNLPSSKTQNTSEFFKGLAD